jgi:hypothetical protein
MLRHPLHADCASCFDHHEEWDAFFRQYQPSTLVLWGEGGFVLGVRGAEGHQGP